MRRALSGLSVVELGRGIAPGYCGKLFADLGAEVVMVEDPADAAGGELSRLDDGDGDSGGRSRSGLALHLNTNKRSVALRPDDTADRRTFRALVETADLVIESRHHGVLGDWGIEWEDLHRSHPAASVVSISGFGASGPYKDYKWDDIVVQAMAGALLLQGHPEQPPVRLPGHLCLCFVGHVAGLGALAAVTAAGEGQGGSFVDCSALEALATLPSRQAPLLGYQYRGCIPDPVKPYASATLIPTGVFPCADGYVALMSTTQQLDEMLEVLGDPAAKEVFQHPDAFDRPETKEVLDVALYTWLALHTRAEATALAQEAGWPLTGVYSVAEVLQADHLHQRNFWIHADDPEQGSLNLPGPWCRFEEGGWSLRRIAPGVGDDNAEVDAWARNPDRVAIRPPAANGAFRRPPLEGVRVLDLTVVWSGPYATMLLADLGAEVIRVENPFVLPPTTKGYHPRPILTNPGFLGNLYGPPRPGAPDRPWNRHAMNNSIARNKLSATIDIRRDEGRELLMRLAEQSDVFIDNFKANGLDRIGIDVSELRRRNPRLIIVRLPPAGLTGDYASYTGFGAQFDALSGLLSICGHIGSDPTATPATTYMDGASGPAGAFAVTAALRYRSATGRGQFVELSQYENVINHLGAMFVDQQMGIEPERQGNRDTWRAPQGLYHCQEPDRWIAISVGDDQTWISLAETIGRPELGRDGRFSSAPARRANHDQLDRLISEWAEKQPLMAAFHTLQAAGVPAGPLLDDELFTADPHLKARDWLRPLESGDVGVHPHPGFAFTGIPQAWRRGSPTLGEDNEYVYKKLLAVPDDEYRRYEQEKILATDYLMPDGTPY
jgi:crotonobetainyl-CoA:carnitine CoA-transferase CaiB-like acyl-CoA transferase